MNSVRFSSLLPSALLWPRGEGRDNCTQVVMATHSLSTEQEVLLSWEGVREEGGGERVSKDMKVSGYEGYEGVCNSIWVYERGREMTRRRVCVSNPVPTCIPQYHVSVCDCDTDLSGHAGRHQCVCVEMLPPSTTKQKVQRSQSVHVQSHWLQAPPLPLSLSLISSIACSTLSCTTLP